MVSYCRTEVLERFMLLLLLSGVWEDGEIAARRRRQRACFARTGCLLFLFVFECFGHCRPGYDVRGTPPFAWLEWRIAVGQCTVLVLSPACLSFKWRVRPLPWVAAEFPVAPCRKLVEYYRRTRTVVCTTVEVEEYARGKGVAS